LVDLPQNPLQDAGKAKESYETHFNDESNEATTSDKIPEEVEMSNQTT
jgi:hypothetical protein